MNVLGRQIHLIAVLRLANPSWTTSGLTCRSLHVLRHHADPHSARRLTLRQSLLKTSPRPSSTLSDASPAPPTTWVDRMPKSVRPYLYLTRIDKPIGTLLLFYPCGRSPRLMPVLPELTGVLLLDG